MKKYLWLRNTLKRLTASSCKGTEKALRLLKLSHCHVFVLSEDKNLLLYNSELIYLELRLLSLLRVFFFYLWYWGLNLPRGILLPSYTPSPIFLFFILKQGLTKLWRATLSSWGWPRTCNPPVSASRYWDYKHAPPCLALYSILE